MTLEEAKTNVQNVLDQLRMTKPEREVLDGSLATLYVKATEAEDLEKELQDARKPTQPV
jgi:hypothetical protein